MALADLNVNALTGVNVQNNKENYPMRNTLSYIAILVNRRMFIF